MKHLLFATTALIAATGMAAAEVNFSGYGRFGIGYMEDREENIDKAEPGVSDTILVSRFRLTIDAITETDSGVKFEARIRAQADDSPINDKEMVESGEASEAKLSGARFSVSYEGLRVDAGNVSDVFDNLNAYYGTEPGLETFIGQYSGVDYGPTGFSSNNTGANGVFFQYAIENFAFGASYDQNSANDHKTGDRWGISATYGLDNITAALAYGEDEEDSSLTVLTLAAEFDNFEGSLFLADDDVADASKNGTAYGVSAAYNIGGATKLTFAYGDGSGDADKRQIGVGVIHDLGGGASLRGGIGESKTGDADGVMQADLGVQFNF